MTEILDAPPQTDFSVVIPALNEAESLPELIHRLHDTFAKMNTDAYEIIVIDDGSSDATQDVLAVAAQADSRVKSVRLRRNCGKALGLMAGFQRCAGRFVVTMDADLQDNPEDIPALRARLDDGFDLVGGWRTSRRDQGIRIVGSKIFNATVTHFTGLTLHDLNCGFKIYRRAVVQNLCLYGQYHRYVPVMAHLLGFRVGETPVTNSERKFGTSKYRTFRYHGFFDFLSLLFLHKYAHAPLHFFAVVAAILIIPSFFLLTVMVGEHFAHLAGFDYPQLANRPLLVISLISLLSGIVIFLTGFVCDFVLHHLIRAKISQTINQFVVSPDERG